MSTIGTALSTEWTVMSTLLSWHCPSTMIVVHEKAFNQAGTMTQKGMHTYSVRFTYFHVWFHHAVQFAAFLTETHSCFIVRGSTTTQEPAGQNSSSLWSLQLAKTQTPCGASSWHITSYSSVSLQLWFANRLQGFAKWLSWTSFDSWLAFELRP